MDGKGLGKNKMNLSNELTQLLLSLPRTIDQDREDINELVSLGLAVRVKTTHVLPSFRRTQAGKDYIQALTEDQRTLKYK